MDNIEIPNVVKPLLEYIAAFSTDIFKDKLIGLYLFGSLTYGDYKEDRSDVDLMAVIEEDASDVEIAKVKGNYNNIGIKFPVFKNRVECSYTPMYMLKEIAPPLKGRVYFGEKFYSDATYGNEWIINNYLIREHGLTIMGPDFRTLTPNIDISQIQQACLNDLQTEWIPRINDDSYLSEPHYQSYLVLNLCRIIYTLKQSKTGSKTEASNWVIATYPKFKNLVGEALAWTYGESMDRKDEVKSFIELIAKEAGLN